LNAGFLRLDIWVQPRSAGKAEVRLRGAILAAIRTIDVRVDVAPMNNQIPNIRNPSEGIRKYKNRIWFVE
jgi:hypothetical protein